MQLKRQFGLWTAVALIIGQVIAVGIFLTPAGMAKSVGSPFWLLVIWLLIGAMTLSGALCYGELSSRFPQSGGSYVYLKQYFGQFFDKQSKNLLSKSINKFIQRSVLCSSIKF
jgi:APA family basic amino acid/polyamine antiporter